MKLTPEAQILLHELCGDDQNGGLIRDLCFTVWQRCQNPTHPDGKVDWGSDTLPAVQYAVREIRKKIEQIAPTAPEPCFECGSTDMADRVCLGCNKIEDKDDDLTQLRALFARFRTHVFDGVTQWQAPHGSHHHPIWAEVAEALKDAKAPLAAARDRLINAENIAQASQQVRESWERLRREMTIDPMDIAVTRLMAHVETQWSYHADDIDPPRDFWHVRLNLGDLSTDWLKVGAQAQQALPQEERAIIDSKLRQHLIADLSSMLSRKDAG